ncbi:TolC family protein [Caldithrix abyssi]|nr:TolC family protein [Caldithrix abyssi]
MKYSRLALVILTGFNGLSSLSQAQTITLDEFLDQLKQKHPLFEKERLTVQIEKEAQSGYLGTEDWLITSGPYYSRQNPLPPGSFTPDRVDQISVGAMAGRTYWKTGGRLSFSWSSNLTDQTGLEDIVLPLGALTGNPQTPDIVFETGPSKYYRNELAVTYVHPLLKNRNGFLDRLQYDLKEFDIDFSEVQSVENQEDFIASVAGKFLDWVLLTKQKQIIQDRLSLSKEELARTQKKREANLVDEVDVIRAGDAVRIAKRNQVLIESRWKALQAELAVLTLNNELYHFSPEFNLYELQELPSLEEAGSRLKGTSRLIKTLNVRLNQLQYARKGFEETLKPDLSLVAQVNTKNLDEGFGESLKMDKLDTYVGLQFSLPLNNRTAKSQITKTNLRATQLKKQLLDLSLTLTSALTNLHIQIDKLEEVLRLDIEQIESAKEKTQEELRLYDQGRGELTFVIQSQDSEENAKLTYVGDAVTYHKLIIAYRTLMDELYN